MPSRNSCYHQGGDWIDADRACKGRWDTPNCVDKTEATPGEYGDYGKKRCLDLVGCTWESPDGTKAQNPDLGAKCQGTPLPCRQQTKLHCFPANGCEWSTQLETCGNANNNSESTQPSCTRSGLSVQADPNAVTSHPSDTRWICLQQLGCTWKRADGTVVTADY